MYRSRASRQKRSYGFRRPRFYNRGSRPRVKPRDAFEEKHPRNYKIKYHIQSDIVRVIDEEGKNLGVFKLDEAIRTAEERGYDLVLAVPYADPPVCRIVNYESFKYQIQKKEKEQKKKSKAAKLKEIKFSPLIAEGDLVRKIDNIKRFLAKGHQVKVTIMRKRRITNDQIKEFQEKVLTILKDFSTILNTQNKGRNVYILLKAVQNAKIKDSKNSSQKGEN